MMIKSQEDKVISILEKIPGARDSDTLLVALIWDDELGGPTKTHKMSAYQLLVMLSRGELPNYRSISRCRSKVEESREDLRGKNYAARQRHQAQVKKEIIDWDKVEKDGLFEPEDTKGKDTWYPYKD
jgi:hypothetical protein